jgi:3-oxoacyl-[acyl-carrier protein] reductase
MSKLTGKVAVVTGASKGIGAAIDKSLAAEGASVVVNYASSKAGADTVVAAITAAGGKAVAVGGDVSKAAEANGIIDAAIKNYGRLDILVNNSGVYEFTAIEAITEEQFHKAFNVNVLGLLLTTQAAVKHLSEGASIINIGSVASRITPPNSVVYTGTKGAVDAITGVLSRELGPKESVYRLVHPSVSQSEFLELFDDCRRRLFERGQGDFRDRDFIEDLAPDYCRCTDLHRRHRQQRDPDPGGDQGNQRRHFPSDLPYRWDYIGAIENS